MTPQLERVLAEVQKLTDPEQDAIAMLILDELADERRWQESYARSQDRLGLMAATVRRDIAAGNVTPGGFD